MKKQTISFVIPIYNEEKRLPKTFKALGKLSLQKGPTSLGASLGAGQVIKEIIFVNDGSKDRSKTKIQTFKLNKTLPIKLISYKHNRGKGYAVRTGLKQSTADYTLVFDADMSTPLSELIKFVPFIKREIDVIIGTRKNGHSTVIVHQPKIRELLGRGFTTLANIVLSLEVTDITCGFKMFSKKARIVLSDQARIDGWAYDAELLYVAQKNKLRRVEKAVLWSNDQETKVKVTQVIPQTLRDLGRILWYHKYEAISMRYVQQLELEKRITHAQQELASFVLDIKKLALTPNNKKKRGRKKKSPLSIIYAEYNRLLNSFLSL